MKHTPGPWTISKTATPEWCKQYLVYADVNPSGNLALVYTCEESEANARLIAAAPDLLEVCVRLLSLLEEDPKEFDSHVEAKNQAYATIKKATGAE